MSSNALFFGWNRPIPGRERISAQHFQEFSGYLDGLRQRKQVESYDAVFLDSHGGDLNGFFLIRGDHDKLDAVMASQEWMTHLIRAALHLEGSGAIRGATGPLIQERMQVWTGLLPS